MRLAASAVRDLDNGPAPITDPAELAQVLSAAGIEASLQPVRATIEERMLMLSRQAKAS